MSIRKIVIQLKNLESKDRDEYIRLHTKIEKNLGSNTENSLRTSLFSIVGSHLYYIQILEALLHVSINIVNEIKTRGEKEVAKEMHITDDVIQDEMFSPHEKENYSLGNLKDAYISSLIIESRDINSILTDVSNNRNTIVHYLFIQNTSFLVDKTKLAKAIDECYFASQLAITAITMTLFESTKFFRNHFPSISDEWSRLTGKVDFILSKAKALARQ